MLSNTNAINFFKWIFISKKKDNFDQIVFLFISRKNSTNYRFLNLFDASEGIRVVYFMGLPISLTDMLTLKIFRFLVKLTKNKIEKYSIVHQFNTENIYQVKKIVLHVDDPTYSENEAQKLLDWETKLNNLGVETIIICTNQYTQKWLLSFLALTKVEIVQQGYGKILTSGFYPKEEEFRCVYTSPYIHYGRDKHGLHSTWGSRILIEEIIPKLHLVDPTIQIILIGKVGRNAKKALDKYTNVKKFGLVNSDLNMQILSTCHIGIYPRDFDHKRSMLKLFNYIGANLPIVTFDLIDTEIVKQYSLGYSVNNTDEFIAAILELKNSPDLFNAYKLRVEIFKKPFTWSALAKKMELVTKIPHASQN